MSTELTHALFGAARRSGLFAALLAVSCTLGTAFFGSGALAQSTAGMTPEQRRAEFGKLPWQNGPVDGAVGAKGTLKVPDKARLLPDTHGGRFLELTGNLPEPGNTILVSGNWWAVLSYSSIGYIKDDEKLDADALLRTLKESDGPANEERKKRGIAQLTTEGWAVPPHFDPQTKHLEWGLRLRAEGDPNPVINYTVRMLSRGGYENVTLVSDPTSLTQDVAELKAMLKGFSFNKGESYAEFKPGDHVAEIGLGALVLGGAAAAAVKGGWWKALLGVLAAGWKVIAGVGVALALGIGKLFGRKKQA
jgi:uncharacterized membrane-anchored protein